MGIDRYWITIGYAAAFVVFWAVAFFVSAFSFWGRGFLETCIPGAAAAYFTYKYFEKKDKDVMAKLLTPPDQVWPVPLPIAWGTVKDVLCSTGVETRESGRQNWKMLQEDKSRGLLRGQLDFAEGVAGQGGEKAMAPRSIGLTVILSPDPAGSEGTKVKMSYQIL